MQYTLTLAYCLLVLTACGGRATTGDQSLAWIELSTNDGWLMMVDSDGSGYLAYGQFSGQRVSFPATTFDFSALQRKIRGCNQTYTGEHALVSRIFSARSNEIEQFYCHDTLIGQRWLSAAFRALPRETTDRYNYRRLCRRWREQPPLDLAFRAGY